MMRRARLRIVRLVVAAVVLGAAATAHAQNATVRVTKDKAPLWRRNPSFIVATAKVGQTLEVVGREQQWLQVLLPSELGGKGNDTAFIFVGHVALVTGTLPPETAGTQGAVPPVPPAAPKKVQVRGFGEVAYNLFAADRSFKAVMDNDKGWFFGGGAQVVIAPGVYVEGSVDYYEKTGQRVFIHNNQVFGLGIDDKVRIIPLQFTAGYRVPGLGRVVPYVGGGGGVYFFKEEADFAEAGDNVDDNYGSYHIVGGVEFTGVEWASTAFEVQWTKVTSSIGIAGVSQVFGEDDLGGVAFRLKILFGK
jgi:hypothetical protein